MIIFYLRNWRQRQEANNDKPARDIINPTFDRDDLENNELHLQPTQIRHTEGYHIHIDTRTPGNQSQNKAAVVHQEHTRPTAGSYSYARPDKAAVVGQERNGVTAVGYSHARPDGEIGVIDSAFNQPVYDEIPVRTEEETATYANPLPLLQNFETNAEHQGGRGLPLPLGQHILVRVEGISQTQTRRGSPEYRNLPPIANSNLVSRGSHRPFSPAEYMHLQADDDVAEYRNLPPIANPNLVSRGSHRPLSPEEYMHLQTDDVAVQSYQQLSAASTPASSGEANPFHDQHIHVGTSRNARRGHLDEGDEYESMA